MGLWRVWSGVGIRFCSPAHAHATARLIVIGEEVLAEIRAERWTPIRREDSLSAI